MQPSYRGWKLRVEVRGGLVIAWAESDMGLRVGAGRTSKEAAIAGVQALVDEKEDAAAGERPPGRTLDPPLAEY
jgi:hypothetical protein